MAPASHDAVQSHLPSEECFVGAGPTTMAAGTMMVKHLCLARFKDGAAVDDVLRGMADLVAGMDMVKSFEWGRDVLHQEALTQGFTHAFSLTFASADDLAAYMAHERHAAFAATFMAAIDKVVVLDFPVVVAKPPPPPPPA